MILALLADYSLYFGLTLVLSTLFAMGGVGSAIALVPSLSMAGMAFDPARALGLCVNTAATAAASVTHLRHGMLDVRFALPLALALLVAPLIGAWSSQSVAHGVLEAILIVFLIVAAILLLIPRCSTLVQNESVWPLLAIGAGVGVISGMLGVGGGALLLPALILSGHDAKKAARAIGFVIPFSTAGAFLTYLSFTQMDWVLLGVVAVAAILGGYLGGHHLAPGPERGAGQETHRGAALGGGGKDDLGLLGLTSTKMQKDDDIQFILIGAISRFGTHERKD